MSNPKNSHKQAPGNDPVIATRRARTRLLLGPALAALKQYRAEVVQHLDTTIARLEALAQWCDGAELPAWTGRYGELINTVGRADNWPGDDPSYDAAMNEICDDYHPGPVDACDITIECLTKLATGARGLNEPADGRIETIDDHTRAIALAIHDSNPGPNVMEETFATFNAGIDAAGIAVRGWYIEHARRDYPEMFS